MTQPSCAATRHAETLSAPHSGKIHLVGLDMEELTAALASVGCEKFRSKQIWNWIYVKGVTDFEAMTNIAKPMREKLQEHFTLRRPAIDENLTSIDGTRKWLLEFTDGNKVEAVFIPDTDRGALCVSSQVGCTLTCTFCHTGTMKLVRNLTAEEIIGQVLNTRDQLEEWNKPSPEQIFTNIVMMGMGEPLFNYENVAKALKIIMDPNGIGMSKRRITLSTSGVVPLIERCGEELGVNLAISLHAVTDELRNEIVPINKKYPLKVLLNACRTYPASNNARRITFEYVMLKGINDSDNDARELVRLLKGIPSKVNLIPFNPWPGSDYECSSNSRIAAFAKIVNDAGYSSPVRTPRGRDILAACGQLKSESERKKGQKVIL
ncbi:MAG: 23S rRNA (adenine(2503)-C(2))-methyltransferase RlmN [Alphaproteobacteria bacterium]|nr:23S rRNA (adenine(2503)-C(2))-methyltransferase RlmN [Alphaproteobacteria bacterium]